MLQLCRRARERAAPQGVAQIGSVSRHGHAFIDWALPNEWTNKPAHLNAAHVPNDVGFATKPKIARRMMARAITARGPFSFAAR